MFQNSVVSKVLNDLGKLVLPNADLQGHEQPRTQGTFRNESTLVDRGHVVSLYCPDFGQLNNLLLYFSGVAGLKLTPFNYSINMSVYHIASHKINYFIAQNLGNKTKPRKHDPPGYFRS